MVELIIALIIAILTYVTSKKSGNASNTQAALAGLAAGAGTYYVATETEWGQSAVNSLEGWLGVGESPETNPQLQEVTTADGTKVYVPKGTSGSTNMWDTLSSWGPTGTAGVVGTGYLATTGKLDKYMPWIIGGVALFILKR